MKSGRKILIVDDSPTERYFLADLLSKKGYSVVTAESGEEALTKVRLEKPALVVMDGCATCLNCGYSKCG